MRFIAALVVSVVGALAHGQTCANYKSEVVVEGVITEKATYIDPSDFAWAPANGFQSYPVLVTRTPVCFSDDGQYAGPVHVLQIFGTALPNSSVLASGVRVTVRGKIFPAETAHHFERLMLDASAVTIER